MYIITKTECDEAFKPEPNVSYFPVGFYKIDGKTHREREQFIIEFLRHAGSNRLILITGENYSEYFHTKLDKSWVRLFDGQANERSTQRHLFVTDPSVVIINQQIIDDESEKFAFKLNQSGILTILLSEKQFDPKLDFEYVIKEA